MSKQTNRDVLLFLISVCLPFIVWLFYNFDWDATWESQILFFSYYRKTMVCVFS